MGRYTAVLYRHAADEFFTVIHIPGIGFRVNRDREGAGGTTTRSLTVAVHPETGHE